MLKLQILTTVFLLSLTVFVSACGDSVVDTKKDSVSTSSDPNIAIESIMLNPMLENRQDYELVVLSDGRLMSLGGRGVSHGGDSSGNALDTAEVYDPVNDKWTSSGRMREWKTWPSAIELTNGTVLVAGGAIQRESTSLAEIWDPNTGEWTKVASMNVARNYYALISLSDGRAIAIGGADENETNTATAEIYDSETDTWTLIDPMGDKRIWHTSTVLNDGRILITGGGHRDGPFLKSAEIFDPETEKWQYAGEMNIARSHHTATLMTDGRVLIVGGMGSDRNSRDRNTSEIYDPITNSWGSVADTTSPRAEHIAIANSDGSVLVAGGTLQKTMELYDPILNSWTEIGNMQYSRARFHAYKRNDNSIMLIGGQGSERVLAEIESVNITLKDRTQAELDANAESARSEVQKVSLNATPTPQPTATPKPERKTVTNEGMELNFPEAIESDLSGNTITPLGNPVKLALGQSVISPDPGSGTNAKFEALVSDDRENGGTAVVKIKIRMALFEQGSVELTLEAGGGPAAKKLGRHWVGVIDLEYDSDNNPIATVVVFVP